MESRIINMKQLIKIALLCLFPLMSMAQTPAYQKNPRSLRVTDNGQIYKWKDSIYYKELLSDSLGKKVNLADSTIKYITPAGLNYSLSSKQNQKVLIGSWGDSLTEGTGSTQGNSYPDILSLNTGLEYYNGGVGGETSTQIKNRFLSSNVKNKQAVIIWAGRNNYPDVSTVKADIAAMVDDLAGRPFIVLSILNGDYVSERKGGADYNVLMGLNSDLKSLYPNNYIDVREFLVNLYNPANPTDVSNFSMDIPPSTLRSDNIHLNDLGYRKVADFINRHISQVLGDGIISPNTVETNTLRIVGDPNFTAPLYGEGVEGFLNTSQGYIGVYDRTLNTPLPLNLQSYENAILNLNPMGGVINVGDDADVMIPPRNYSTGGYRYLVRNEFSGRMEDVPIPAVPTLQQVSLAGSSTDIPLIISPSINSGFALNISNNGTTNAHGVYVNIGESSTGIIFRTDKNGIEKFSVNNDGSVKVSQPPINPTDVSRLADLGTGWAQYTDNVYTSGSPLTVNASTTATITNNSATSIESQLPIGVSSFYNSGTSKITPELDGDSYLINVRFTAESSSVTGLCDVGIDIGGAMNIISQETVSLRKGVGNSQRVNIVFDVFSGSTFLSNGGLIKLTSIDGDTSIYDISFKITRTHKAK